MTPALLLRIICQPSSVSWVKLRNFQLQASWAHHRQNWKVHVKQPHTQSSSEQHALYMQINCLWWSRTTKQGGRPQKWIASMPLIQLSDVPSIKCIQWVLSITEGWTSAKTTLSGSCYSSVTIIYSGGVNRNLKNSWVYSSTKTLPGTSASHHWPKKAH